MLAEASAGSKVNGRSLLQHAEVHRAVRLEQLRDTPARARHDRAHLTGRDEQVLEPRRPGLAAAHADAKLPREPPAATIPLVVTPMVGAAGSVGVSGFGEDSSGRRGEVVEAPEEPSGSAGVAEQPEVVSEHDDGVELAEAGPYAGDGKDARIAHSTEPAGLHCKRRGVDRDDAVAASLEMQCHAAGSATDVERPATRVPHGASLMKRPLPERSELGGRARRDAEPAIVAFDHLGRGIAAMVVSRWPPKVACRR